jgi:hypothetical protein
LGFPPANAEGFDELVTGNSGFHVVESGSDCPPDAAGFPTAPDGKSVRVNCPALTG